MYPFFEWDAGSVVFSKDFSWIACWASGRPAFESSERSNDSGNRSIIGSSKQGMLHIYQQTIRKRLNKTWWHAQRLVLLFFAMDVYEQVNTFNTRNTSLFFRFNIASSQQSTNIKNQCISGSFGHLCGWHCSATSQQTSGHRGEPWMIPGLSGSIHDVPLK